MKRVAYFTNIAPHYRNWLWLEMSKNQKVEFHFFYGQPEKNGIKSMVLDSSWTSFLNRLHSLKNIRIGQVLIFQFGVISNVLFKSWDSLIFLGDMYLLSTWIGVILARIKGTKVYFWGHGIYGNESAIKRFFRVIFLRLADGHFLYNQRGKSLLLDAGFSKDSLHVVYNSLDYESHKALRNSSIESDFFKKRKYFQDDQLPVIIFIGRLTEVKRLDKIIDTLRFTNSVKYNVLFVGDGPDKNRLQRMANDFKGRVYFYGPCYDEQELSKLVANADLCVSPGNVGLTAIHSLSFGTPVCTHNDMAAQMPEAETIIEGVTGTLYDVKENNLGLVICRWLESKHNRNQLREQCYNVIDSCYNQYYQVQIFEQVLTVKTS